MTTVNDARINKELGRYFDNPLIAGVRHIDLAYLFLNILMSFRV